MEHPPNQVKHGTPDSPAAIAGKEALRELLITTGLSDEDMHTRRAAIRAALLARSSRLHTANFKAIHPDDLELLFDACDAALFQGAVRGALGAASLGFSISARMTSAGGKTTRRKHKGTGAISYELSVSGPILFNCFDEEEPHRAITACGVACHDRLEALQRVMEHEMAHLIELLVWNATNCSAVRFQAITSKFFGHAAHTHSMITPQEAASVKHGIRPGVAVQFMLDGLPVQGVVNRVTLRATVLVEHPQGQRYTNGKHYLKYLVPLRMLEVLQVA